MQVLGIDPGLNGGAAIVQVSAPDRFVLLDTISLPLMGDSNRQRINVAEFQRWLLRFNVRVGIIERVGLMPDQNVAAGGKFMRAVGMIEAAALLTGVQLHAIEVIAWKKRYSLIKQDKEAARQRAIELFGGEQAFFPLKKHHNRAEAALIARFGAEHFAKNANTGAHDGAARNTG